MVHRFTQKEECLQRLAPPPKNKPQKKIANMNCSGAALSLSKDEADVKDKDKKKVFEALKNISHN